MKDGKNWLGDIVKSGRTAERISIQIIAELSFGYVFNLDLPPFSRTLQADYVCRSRLY